MPRRGTSLRTGALDGRRTLRLGLALLALAGLPACGGTLYLTMKGSVPRTRDEVFECAKTQIQVLGYNQASLDKDAFRLTARKPDYETRVADTQFRRMMNRLEIEVGKPADDGRVPLKIVAHTFTELMTQRGPTDVEETATQAARTDAQAILDACGS